MTPDFRPAEARRRREAAGITIEQFAAKVGVTASTISRWERSVSRPRGLQRRAYLRAIGRLSDVDDA